MSGVNPSPVFPGGLSPTKQSEIQLNNVELEGKVWCHAIPIMWKMKSKLSHGCRLLFFLMYNKLSMY